MPARAIAVDPRAIDPGAIIIMRGSVGIAPAIIAIIIRAAAVGVPTRDRAFLVGRIRREIAGAAEGRALVDVIILAEAYMLPTAAIILLVRVG